MNNYLKEMMDEAINSIDALSINDLEKEFRAFGIDVERKLEQEEADEPTQYDYPGMPA